MPEKASGASGGRLEGLPRAKNGPADALQGAETAFWTHFEVELRSAGRSNGLRRVEMPCRYPQNALECPLAGRKGVAWTFNHGWREVPETALEAIQRCEGLQFGRRHAYSHAKNCAFVR